MEEYPYPNHQFYFIPGNEGSGGGYPPVMGMRIVGQSGGQGGGGPPQGDLSKQPPPPNIHQQSLHQQQYQQQGSQMAMSYPQQATRPPSFYQTRPANARIHPRAMPQTVFMPPMFQQMSPNMNILFNSMPTNARHQQHAPTASNTSGFSFIPQPIVMHNHHSFPYYVHRNTYPQNPAPQTAPAQPPPPQQQQVVNQTGSMSGGGMMGGGGGGGGGGVVTSGGGGGVGGQLSSGAPGGGGVGGVGGVVVTGGLVGGPGGPGGGQVVGPPGSGAGGGGGQQGGVGGPQGQARRLAKRPFAIQIVHPVTGKDIVEEMMLSIEETHSSDSTPQPPSGGGDGTVAAEFATQVAVSTIESSSVVLSPEMPNGPNTHEIVQPEPPVVVHHHPPPPSAPPHIVHEVPKQHKIQQPSTTGKPMVVDYSKSESGTPVVSAMTDSPAVEVHHHRAACKPPASPAKAVNVPPFVPASAAAPTPVPTKPKKAQAPQPPISAIQMQEAKKEEPPKKAAAAAVVVSSTPAPPVGAVVVAVAPKKEELLAPAVPTKRSAQPPKREEPPAPEPPTPAPLPTTTLTKPKTLTFAESLNLKNMSVGVSGSSSSSSTPTPTPTPTSSAPTPVTTPHHQHEGKQTNGETHDQHDGKAMQRQKNKKGTKMRDLNKKGTEKEGGTEMDVFTEAPRSVQQHQPTAPVPPAAPQPEQPKAEEKKKSPSPTPAQVKQEEPPKKAEAAAPPPAPVEAEPPPPKEAAPAPAPTPAPEAVEKKVSPVEAPAPAPEERRDEPAKKESSPVAQEAEEEEKSRRVDSEAENGGLEDDEEDLMVQSKNEENAKVSAAQNKSSEVIETQIIERSVPLKYTYSDDQWSPLNKDGKKVYGREFLMDLRNDPLSSRKPEYNVELAELFVKDKDSNKEMSNNNNNRQKSLHGSSSSYGGMTRGNSFAPEFMRNSNSGQRPSLNKRMSQPGSRGPVQRSSKQYMSSSMMKNEPKHVPSENAWRPEPVVDTNLPDEERKTKALYKKVRGILNRLTPEKFDTLVGQVMSLPIDSYKRLDGVMELVFKKAVDEPGFSRSYAEMCRNLSKIQVAQSSDGKKDGAEAPQPVVSTVNFRKLLITRCQTEFEKIREAEDDVEKKIALISAEPDPEKRKELQLQFEEEERKMRVKSVGLVRFIGELYKLNMLTLNIMHGCVKRLISKIDEESLECLCKLLMTIGKDLEKQSETCKSFENDWNGYFDRMAKLSQKGSDCMVSSRVRFMLQDVIELRANKWVPRRVENAPKTIEQIQKEVERDAIESANFLANATPRKHDNRDDRRRAQRIGQSEDGWQSVQGNKAYRGASYQFEMVKLQQMKVNTSDQDSVLGSSNQFGRWGSGASIKKSELNKPFADSNTYALLATEEKKSSQQQQSSQLNTRGLSNKMAPSASSEKERGVYGVREAMLSKPRGQGSGPPSRESSQARYVGGQGSQHGGDRDRDRERGGRGGGPDAATQAAQHAAQVAQAAAAAAPHQSAPPAAKAMSEDELKRKTKTILDEHRAYDNIKDSIEDIKSAFVGQNLDGFVGEALNSSIDVSTSARTKCAELMGQLIKRTIVPPQTIVKEFKVLFEYADDLMIDIPQIWKYLAEFLVPILLLEVLNFNDFKDMFPECSQYTAKVLAETLSLLIKDKGPGWIRTQWEASKVQLSDFVPEPNVDTFIKDNSCSFLFGNGEVIAVDNNLSNEDIEQKILEFLQSSKHDLVFDHISDWLKANVGDKRLKEANFIRALTRAVISHSIKGEKLDDLVLTKHEKLIKRYVDTAEDLELVCLYAIQNLVVNEMEAPKGLLQNIIQLLYDSGTISYDGLMKWKERDSSEESLYENTGKGVAMTTLSTFFSSLSDEPDDEIS